MSEWCCHFGATVDGPARYPPGSANGSKQSFMGQRKLRTFEIYRNIPGLCEVHAYGDLSELRQTLGYFAAAAVSLVLMVEISRVGERARTRRAICFDLSREWNFGLQALLYEPSGS